MKRHSHITKAQKKQKKRIYNLSEYALHCQIAQYLNMVIKSPSRWLTIEVSNHGSGKAAMINQMMDRKRGVITGFPDIAIWHKYFNADCDNWHMNMIFLEVKIPGGKLTEKQENVHNQLKEEGHYVSVVYSVDDVKNILEQMGVI